MPRYGLSRYGLPDGGTLRRAFSGMATLRLASLARKDVIRTVSFSERLRLSGNLSSGMRRGMDCAGGLFAAASATSRRKREIRAATAIGLSGSLAVNKHGGLDAAAALGLRAGLSADRASAMAASGAVGGFARLTVLLHRAAALGAAVGGAATACADMHSKARFCAGVWTTTWGCKDILTALDRRAALSLLAALGKTEGRRLAFADSLSLVARAVKDCPHAFTGAAGLYAHASSGYLDHATCTVQCAIPPGGTLVIDTEHFTVTLDDENILHLQEGDWPLLSRDTLSLSVSSGTGGPLEGRVVYQEAFL